MKKLRFAIVIIILAAVFHFVPFFDPAEAWVTRGFLGIGGSLRAAGMAAGGFVRDIGRVGALEKENSDLKSQVLSLKQQLASGAGLLTENESLKGLLAFRERTDLALVPADVIGADPDPTMRALILNVGSEDGIVRGDPVIVNDGVLVGKIERVSPGRSTVLLPTDPRSAIAVRAADHPEADGVAQGEKGLAVNMILIPQHAAIRIGEPIVTTGRENRVPAGLLLGEVESVTAVPSDPFMSAAILPAVDPSALTKVAVIHQE
jgi:rod shape-determining protein MreC